MKTLKIIGAVTTIVTMSVLVIGAGAAFAAPSQSHSLAPDALVPEFSQTQQTPQDRLPDTSYGIIGQTHLIPTSTRFLGASQDQGDFWVGMNHKGYICLVATVTDGPTAANCTTPALFYRQGAMLQIETLATKEGPNLAARLFPKGVNTAELADQWGGRDASTQIYGVASTLVVTSPRAARSAGTVTLSRVDGPALTVSALPAPR